MVFMLGSLALSGQFSAQAAERATVVPPPTAEAPASENALQSVVLAGGCFWGIQAVYQHVEGVHQAVSGYAGGSGPNPSYEQVSSGRTGYAESVQVTFDPRKISLGRSCRFSSPSRTIRPSSIGRDPTSEPNTAPRSFIQTNPRSASRNPISHSSAARPCLATPW
jgi:Peptide methionine sulfoxide reductase